MTKETRQDVFEELAKQMRDYRLYDPERMEPSELVEQDYKEYIQEYAAATPCELPVIPAKLGKMMRAGHEIHADLWTMMNIIANNLTDQDTLDWYFTHSDEFALAWLLNDWEVSE